MPTKIKDIEDIVNLTDLQVTLLINHVLVEQFVFAFEGQSPEFKEKIMRNLAILSPGTADRINETIEDGVFADDFTEEKLIDVKAWIIEVVNAYILQNEN